MKYLWLDTETTGVEQGYDEVITLSGFITDTIDGEIIETFDYKVQPTDFDKLTDSATAVNGITKEMLSTFSNPREVVVEFRDLLERHLPRTKMKFAKKSEKYVLVGYNVRFDADMLNGFFKRHSAKPFVNYTGFITKDIMQMVFDEVIEGRLNLEKHNLGVMCEHFGIDLNPHVSLDDIFATRELYEKLRLR